MTQNADANLEFDSLFPAIPFSRRSFVVTALGAGFALSVQPVEKCLLIAHSQRSAATSRSS